MKIDGVPYRTIWPADDARSVDIIDQTKLPHLFEVVRLRRSADAAHAVRAMLARGAPLIGVTAAYGVALAMDEDPGDAALARACEVLLATRPTAVNLRWGIERMRARLASLPPAERRDAAYREVAAS